MIVKNDINTSNSCVTIDNEGERQIVNFRSKKIDFKYNHFITANNFNAYLTDGRLENATILILKEAKRHNKPGILDAENPVSKKAVKIASHVAFSLQGLESFTNTST